MSRPPMWVCPDCGRTFAARNQVHTCRPLGSVEPWLESVDPGVRATYHAFADAVVACGPAEVLAERSRIAFQRMSFAVVVPRKHWLDGHLVLAGRVESPRFRRVTTYSPRNHVHEFRLAGPDEIDTEFRGWIADAYAVGEQRHHAR